MFVELDIVKAKRNLSQLVNENTIGTIVMIYTDPSIAYEVEFFDGYNNTIELLTVKESHIEILKKWTT